jgi:hypothetical protein
MPTQDDDDSLGDPEYQDDNLHPSEFEDEYEDELGGEAKGQPSVHYSDGGTYEDDIYETDHIHQEPTPWYKSRRMQCLVLIPLLVGMGFGIAAMSSNTNSSSAPNAAALEEPPADLSKTCSISAISQGRELCMEACERAECCDFPATIPLSCLEGNQDKCLVYHAQCSNLAADSHNQSAIPSSVPPAPANLGELCTSASLQTVDGFTGCHSACKRAECCYEDSVGTCTHDECAAYAPCLTLAATDHVHKDIPKTVEQVCASDRLATLEGRASCRQACSHALCCFLPAFSNNEQTACLHEDDSFCSQYTKCDKLESVNPVEATPAEIKLTCNDDENIPGHISLCELVCQKGACCFSDVGCDTAVTNVQCDNYEPCRKVFIASDDGGTDMPVTNNDGDGQDDSNNDSGGSTTRVVNKEEIDAACEKAGIVEVVTIPGQQTLCHTVCEPGRCCFVDQDCQVDDQERHCTNFSACSKVFGTLTAGDDETTENQNPTVDTEALKAACGTDESVDPSDVVNMTECETLCEQGSCCYADEYCSVPDPEQFCSSFGYCDKIVDDDDEGDDDDDDENNDDADLKDFQDGEPSNSTGGDAEDPTSLDKETLDAACAGTGETEMCRELCDEAKCCFQTEGCEGEHSQLQCTNFVACLKFHVEIDFSKTPDVLEANSTTVKDSSALQAACADNAEVFNIPGQPSLCETLCADGDCCFKPEGCSAEDLIRYWSMDDPKQFCAPFAVCSKFHT